MSGQPKLILVTDQDRGNASESVGFLRPNPTGTEEVGLAPAAGGPEERIMAGLSRNVGFLQQTVGV